MSDFERSMGFQDCWRAKPTRTVRSSAAGYFGVPRRSPKADDGTSTSGQGKGRAGQSAGGMSASDKATLARVVRRAPEVMVRVTRPSKTDKSGNPIKVNRASEGVRLTGHIEYISRNGKIELETSDGLVLDGKRQANGLSAQWLVKHDEDILHGDATQRTRVATSMVFSMPAHVNAEGVKDAVRSLAEDEFGGRHDYVMALHTDTKHPHVHLTVRTVGEDGIKLNLRKADLQHLRDQFASRLRQRGIDAEATPRHARGVPHKSPSMAMYKIRQRGQVPTTDRAKRDEVERDMTAHGGRLPDYPWDHAMMNRRNRVMGTYMRAATALARSEDAEERELARDTERFVASLTSSRTERVQMASEASQGRSAGRSGVQGGERASERGRGPREDEKGRPDRER